MSHRNLNVLHNERHRLTLEDAIMKLEYDIDYIKNLAVRSRCSS